MELKSLAIRGFKSFADETQINFNQNITGVVGPNGCGKSNIVDAIRWVLGEQKSKELRSDKMSSVIFNGTKKRKQGGRATVSLTFENTKNVLPTEYQTVTITRTLYRSGESEYKLNDIPCRLKDITSLFLDTGIGSNSYAIIALGMVDDLLNDREQSRRRLFEQAAGISKYKKRKRETLNKLKGTEADLARVEDLLFEIEGNLKTLEKQAKRAKKFFEIKEQYKELSIQLAIQQLAVHKNNYKKIKAQITEQEDKKLGLQAQANLLEANLEKEKAKNVDKEKSLSDRQKDLNRKVGIIRGKENDKKVLAQKLIFIQQNKTNLFRQIEHAQTNLEQTEKDIVHYRGEINNEKELEKDLEDNLNEAETILKSIREKHGSVKTELDEFMLEQQTQERNVFELEKKKAIQNNQRENLIAEIEKNSREITGRQNEVNTLKQKISAQDDIRNEKESYIHKLIKEEESRKEELAKTEHDFEDIKQHIVGLNRKLDSQRNEYKLTKSLVDNLEGFPESIKFLNKNKKWNTKAPLLSDIIYCKEEYRVSIENYLDNYLNYYVVEGLPNAIEAISLLSKSQKGKANFFLLDELKKHQSPLNLQSTIPDGMMRAVDIVDVDKKYQALSDYLLGNVWVTNDENPPEDFDTEDMVLLSAKGKFVKSKFILSGGSVGLFEGKRIGRKKNLEVLSKSINDLEKDGKTYSEKFEKLRKRIDQLKNKDQRVLIDKEKDSLNRLQQGAVSLTTKLENFESFLNEVEKKNKEARESIEAIEKQDKEIEIKLGEAKMADGKIKEKIGKMDSSYRSIAEELSNASTDYNQKNIEFIRQQNKINSLQRELSYREKQLRDTKGKLVEDQLSQKNAEEDIVQTQMEVEQLEKDLIFLYEEKDTYEKTLSNAEQLYYDSRGSINEIDEQLRKANKATQDIVVLITSLKDRFNEIKIDLSSIGERLRIEFDVDINDLINQDAGEEVLNHVEVEEKVERLRKRIHNYGEINPMAVEAYDEMDERFQFISGQRKDLLDAKETLLDTIQEIEDTATEQFLEAFNKVRENFKEVFRSLFTEDDDCDLFLEDATRPLDSPIKITAKPKGKRPQSINQLSGGEKTLTATALLFSLYLLKPAPFCIFDEVDAPLDDANIGKFNKIIKKFSSNSQFIIVTHNKQTMAAVDVIYGVTMAEQGVSRVVPVDFRSLN